MKLEKAIEILADFQRRFPITLGLDDHVAVQLGVEALRDVKKARCGGPALDGELLPGETEPEPQPTRDEVKRYMDERKGEPKE